MDRGPLYQAASYDHKEGYLTSNLQRIISCALSPLSSSLTKQLTQQAGEVEPMPAYCWSSVADVGPTLSRHWVGVLCLPGWLIIRHYCLINQYCHRTMHVIKIKMPTNSHPFENWLITKENLMTTVSYFKLQCDGISQITLQFQLFSCT